MKEIQSQSAGTKRILWVDICKALAITLVVVGHATGQFNQLDWNKENFGCFSNVWIG